MRDEVQRLARELGELPQQCGKRQGGEREGGAEEAAGPNQEVGATKGMRNLDRLNTADGEWQKPASATRAERGRVEGR